MFMMSSTDLMRKYYNIKVLNKNNMSDVGDLDLKKHPLREF
jgi:hypothetical protein